MYRDTELLQEALRDIMPLRKALRYDPNHGCANLQIRVVFTISPEIQNTETAQQKDYLIYLYIFLAFPKSSETVRTVYV